MTQSYRDYSPRGMSASCRSTSVLYCGFILGEASDLGKCARIFRRAVWMRRRRESGCEMISKGGGEFEKSMET